MQCIFFSTRLRQWYPVRFRHRARPRYFEDRTASLRAHAPAVLGFRSLAFLLGRITAWAFRAAIASWHLRVSQAPSTVRQCMFTCMRGGGDAAKVLVRRDMVEQVWQHRRIADPAARYLNGAYLQRFLIDTNKYRAPQSAFGPAVLAYVPLTFAFSFDACAVHQ